MSNRVSIQGAFTLNGNAIQQSLTNTVTTSGSLYQNSTQPVTSSWQVLSQNKNNDFYIGAFTNNDATASIKLGVGGTGSYTVLWPGFTNLLSYSGSTTLYASATSGSPLLTYVAVGLN